MFRERKILVAEYANYIERHIIRWVNWVTGTDRRSKKKRDRRDYQWSGCCIQCAKSLKQTWATHTHYQKFRLRVTRDTLLESEKRRQNHSVPSVWTAGKEREKSLCSTAAHSLCRPAKNETEKSLPFAVAFEPSFVIWCNSRLSSVSITALFFFLFP